MNIKYRLGIDLGTNSLGWCLIGLNQKGAPESILAPGARIFTDGRDPQSKASLAENRRIQRGARRRRDRFIQRRRFLLNRMIDLALMPREESERKNLASRYDPYELRAKALDKPLTPFELGRALFHLNQRRGFKSNRKGKTKEETKKIGPRIQGLREDLEKSGARTLGEFLWRRHEKKQTVRAHEGENLYPTRALYESEFETIREAQAGHQKGLSPENWDQLQEIIFHQRPLKPVVPGQCSLEHSRRRAFAALPSFQKFRAAQTLTNLRMGLPGEEKKPLNDEQRKKVWDLLDKQKSLGFGKIRTILKLPDETEFNFEDEKKDKLEGNLTAYLLAGKKYFGKKWFGFSDEQQDAIVEDLLTVEDERELGEKATNEWEVDEESARALAELGPEDFLRGYCRFSKEILQCLVPLMRDAGMMYSEAVESMGYHHSDRRPEKILDQLPYYGTLFPEAVVGADATRDEEEKIYGKIGNPTVHIGLNQLRLVVNEIIRRFGHPHEIVVELARDLKLNQERKKQIIKEQAENQKTNERIARELEALGVPKNRENRLKYQLWEELNPDPNDRRCPYSGEKISATVLFSELVEIEHILPYTRTLDDSRNNKTLSMREANRVKGDSSPFEAFSQSGPPYAYEKILERARHLPARKRWRFNPDAMERYEGENDFLDRQLNDTRYLSRVAKQYLSHVCDPNKVWAIPGQLTALVRGKLGLGKILGKTGEKNRDDHRHHAIDALVAGLTDRAFLQKVSRESDNGRKRIVVPEPWPHFFKEAQESIRRIVVSHRPDHSTKGRLHKKTNYGILNPPRPWEKAENYNVVHTKPLIKRRNIKSSLTASEIDAVRDDVLRQQLQEATLDVSGEQALKECLKVFSNRTGVKRVRVLKKEHPIIEIHHPRDNPRFTRGVVPGNIHHVAFWRLPDGKIQPQGVSVFDANRKTPNELRPHPAAKRVLKIHKGDMMKLVHKGREKIARVVSLSPKNQYIWLVEYQEGGNLMKRYNEKDLEYIFLRFSKIKESQARKIHVDPLGFVRDPGPVL